jgi:hypothetical protein
MLPVYPNMCYLCPKSIHPPIKGGKDLPSPLRERARVRVMFEMNEVDNQTDALL